MIVMRGNEVLKQSCLVSSDDICQHFFPNTHLLLLLLLLLGKILRMLARILLRLPNIEIFSTSGELIHRIQGVWDISPFGPLHRLPISHPILLQGILIQKVQILTNFENETNKGLIFWLCEGSLNAHIFSYLSCSMLFQIVVVVLKKQIKHKNHYNLSYNS